jgi:hypothetical protein
VRDGSLHIVRILDNDMVEVEIGMDSTFLHTCPLSLRSCRCQSVLLAINGSSVGLLKKGADRNKSQSLDSKIHSLSPVITLVQEVSVW